MLQLFLNSEFQIESGFRIADEYESVYANSRDSNSIDEGDGEFQSTSAVLFTEFFSLDWMGIHPSWLVLLHRWMAFLGKLNLLPFTSLRLLDYLFRTGLICR